MTDRRVHAETADMEVVRYDRAGKWYLEPRDRSLPRQKVSIDQAVQYAIWGIQHRDGIVFTQLPGGSTFDAKYDTALREALAVTVPYGSLLKDVADCECGCGLAGTLKKANRKGVRCVRGCVCASCRGRANKRKGQRKQAKAVTALGIPRSSLHPGHEEFLGGSIRVEVKSGAQIRPAVTAYLKCEAQSEAQRPIGDHRPFVAVAMPDGSSDGVAMVRLSVLHEFVAAMVEQWGEA